MPITIKLTTHDGTGDTAMSGERTDGPDELPPLCYIRHVNTGETVLIRRA